MPAPTALVTGAASGIGRRLVGALATAGYRVLATDLDDGRLAEARRLDGWPTGTVVTHRLDVRDPEAWDAAVERVVGLWGRLDVALNVAGYLKPGYTHEADPADVDRHFDVNAKGVALGTRAAARQMVAQKGGHIVNVGSMASLAPVPGLSLYAASKFAVRGLTLAVAEELRPHGVAVSLVMPDAVQTPMLDLQTGYDEAALTFSGARALTVDEVARAVVERVLPERPLELALPPSRAGLARAATVFPGLGRYLGPVLRLRGRRRQRKLRRT